MSEVVVTDQPMSEYEAALFSAVLVLAEVVIDLGGDATKLQARLKECKADAERDGRKCEAGTHELLINLLRQPPG
jgi:hypothetical protein